MHEAADVVRRDPVIDADWPTVSVIVPVYHVKDSSARHSKASWRNRRRREVIVVNDGSTDDSASVAERVAAEHPIVRVFRRENGGPAVARNTASRPRRASSSPFSTPTT